jgi:hypothetical protein
MSTDLYRTFIIRSGDNQPETIQQEDHTTQADAENWMRDQLWAWSCSSIHCHTALGHQLDWDPDNEQYEPISRTWSLYRPHDQIIWEDMP